MKPPNSSPALDRVALLDRVGGDVEFLQEITGLFLEDYPKLLTAILTAVSAGDARKLEFAAHTLKGSVANFGADAARDAAFQLEAMGRAGDLKPAPDACLALEQELQRFTLELCALSAELGRA